MERPPYTFGRVVAYHGCDLEIGKQLLANKTSLTESENAYDWLGPGAYFWVDSAQRGIEWASWKQEQGEIRTPCVVGAFLHLGLCLSLADYGVMEAIKEAYAALKSLFDASGQALPKNQTEEKWLLHEALSRLRRDRHAALLARRGGQ